MKIIASILTLGALSVQADVPTYCNPMSLPGIPVAAGCRNPNPRRAGGASFREIADPSLIFENGTLYLFPSVDMAWKSKDFGVTWEKIDVGIHDIGYAPTIVKHKGRYYVLAGGSQLHVSDSVEGPYKPIGKIRHPGGQVPGYSDPMLYSDDDGRLYLYFGCTPKEGIWGVELNADNPLELVGEPKHLVKFEPELHAWERKPNNPQEAWMEGAWLTKIGGRYCMLFSSAGTENNVYAMGAAWGESPMGPFVKQKRNPFLRSTTGVVRGTSHGSMIPDPCRKDSWIVAYSILVGERGAFERLVGFDRVRLGADGELEVTTPSATPQYADGSGAAPWYRLPFVNAAHPEMSDDNVRTSAPIYEFGEEPVFKAPYAATIRGVRIIWTDRGMDYPSGIVPGPIRYQLQYRLDGKDGWKTFIDKSQNDKDLLVDYTEVAPVRADELRLKVLGAPKGILPSVAELSVFVE